MRRPFTRALDHVTVPAALTLATAATVAVGIAHLADHLAEALWEQLSNVGD